MTYLVDGDGIDKGGDGRYERSQSENATRNDVLMKKTKTDAVIILLQRPFCTTAEQVHDTEEAHIPFVDNKKVYEVFENEFKILNKNEIVPTF